MKAIILLGTLKKEGFSNTATLSAFFATQLAKRNVECEIVKLVDHQILPGTYSDMGAGDAWPALLQRIMEAQIIILATPIWWSNHSSEIQKVIERLDALHDQILSGKPSGLEQKVGGIIITGDSDGSQHIIGGISNFFNAIGLQLPAFATLTVQIKEHAKSEKPSEAQLMKIYEEQYLKTAEKMADALLQHVSG